ncbi:hypothetical protein MMC29_002656 [Sticta canariensis]|nr:hypothetical protein [Sticta canariensis]
MSFFNSFIPQFEAPQAINQAGSTNWAEDPLFAPNPWGSVFFEDCTLSYAVDQRPMAYFSTGFPSSLSPLADTVFEIDLHDLPTLPTQFPLSPPAESTDAVEHHQRASLADTANAVDQPPPVFHPANPAPYPEEPPCAEPVPAALNRRRKAQRQLKAIKNGSEVPVNHVRGRKTLPLGAPKAKYTKRVPGAPKPPPKPKRAYNRRVPAPADLTSVRLGDAATVRKEIEKDGWYGKVGDGLYGG